MSIEHYLSYLSWHDFMPMVSLLLLTPASEVNCTALNKTFVPICKLQSAQ